MTWLEPVSTVVTAASLANDVAKKSSLLKTQFARILHRIRYGNVVIPIFGGGGVGKSTLAKILTGSDPLDLGTPYQTSLGIEVQNLPGEIPGQIIAAPGQKEKAGRYWPDLIKKANEGTSCGLINVVCAGYHSFQIESYKESDLYRDGMSPADFMEVYRLQRQAHEVEMLDRLLNALAPGRRNFFVATLITKQDLWWRDRQNVRETYSTGDYAKRIQAFTAEVGAQRFHHEFIPVSLTISNLTSQSGEMLATTCSGYDHACHLRYLQSFFDNIENLIENHLE